MWILPFEIGSVHVTGRARPAETARMYGTCFSVKSSSAQPLGAQRILQRKPELAKWFAPISRCSRPFLTRELFSAQTALLGHPFCATQLLRALRLHHLHSGPSRSCSAGFSQAVGRLGSRRRRGGRFPRHVACLPTRDPSGKTSVARGDIYLVARLLPRAGRPA